MKKILSFLFFIFSISLFASGEQTSYIWDGDRDSFKELRIDNQIEIYVNQFSDYFGFGSRLDFDIAFEVLSNSTNHEMVSILIKYIEDSQLIFVKNNNPYEAQLLDLKLLNIAFLVANKVNVTHTFDRDLGILFGQIFQDKIKNYVVKYGRIDQTCEEMINHIFVMENRIEQLPSFHDADYYVKMGRLLYLFFHESLNMDLTAVGFEKKYVFPEYSGAILE